MDLENSTRTSEKDTISRKEALVRVGKYAAFTAAATLLILCPCKKAAAGSQPQKPPSRRQGISPRKRNRG